MEVVGIVPKLNDPIPSSDVSSSQLQQIIKDFSKNLTPVEVLNDILYEDYSESPDDIPVINTDCPSRAPNDLRK